MAVARPEYVSERGIEGRAELVTEIHSPGDESYEKVPFCADVGCHEVLIVDRDSLGLELFLGGSCSQPERCGSNRWASGSSGARSRPWS